MMVRRLSDGFIEFELEPSEYHLVLRMPELNSLSVLEIRQVRISFLYEALDTEVLHAKAEQAAADRDSQVELLDCTDPDHT